MPVSYHQSIVCTTLFHTVALISLFPCTETRAHHFPRLIRSDHIPCCNIMLGLGSTFCPHYTKRYVFGMGQTLAFQFQLQFQECCCSCSS